METIENTLNMIGYVLKMAGIFIFLFVVLLDI
jgi:hypothetical protein